MHSNENLCSRGTHIFVSTELQELVHVAPPANDAAENLLLVEHHVEQAHGDIRVGQALVWCVQGRMPRPLFIRVWLIGFRVQALVRTGAGAGGQGRGSGFDFSIHQQCGANILFFCIPTSSKAAINAILLGRLPCFGDLDQGASSPRW